MMQVILYTDKSEVEETAMAASTAYRSVDLSCRTTMLSADAAHSLAYFLDISLGNIPQPIAPNLWGQNTGIYPTLDAYWGTIQKISNKNEEA
jgi:arsenite-transporting ATPase